MGIGSTKKYWLQYGNDAIFASDLIICNRSILIDKLHLLKERMLVKLQHRNFDRNIYWYLPLKQLINEKLHLRISCIREGLHAIPDIHKSDIIFESSQGMLLDEWWGDYPYNTWSSVGWCNVAEIIKELPTYMYTDVNFDLTLIGVTRSYLTRHGKGSFETGKENIDNPYELNSTGTYQGKFKTKLLNKWLLEYSWNTLNCEIENSNIKPEKEMHVTCLDVHNKGFEYSSIPTFPTDKYNLYLKNNRNGYNSWMDKNHIHNFKSDKYVVSMLEKVAQNNNVKLVQNTGV